MISKCFFNLGTACDWNQVHKASSNRNWRAFMIFSHISEPMQEDTTSVIKCRAACGRVDWHWNGKPELSPENNRKSLEHGSLQQFRHWHVWTFCQKQIWNATSATYQRAKCIWTQKTYTGICIWNFQSLKIEDLPKGNPQKDLAVGCSNSSLSRIRMSEPLRPTNLWSTYPYIGSMYGIYANIWGILMVNVTIYIAYMDPMGMSLSPCSICLEPTLLSGQDRANAASDGQRACGRFAAPAAPVRPTGGWGHERIGMSHSSWVLFLNQLAECSKGFTRYISNTAGSKLTVSIHSDYTGRRFLNSEDPRPQVSCIPKVTTPWPAASTSKTPRQSRTLAELTALQASSSIRKSCEHRVCFLVYWFNMI